MLKSLLRRLWPEPRGKHARTAPAFRPVRPDVRPVPVVDPVNVSPPVAIVRPYYAAFELQRGNV